MRGSNPATFAQVLLAAGVTRKHTKYGSGETDESGIKLLTEEGFTRKRLGNNSLQRGERGEKRKRTLRGK